MNEPWTPKELIESLSKWQPDQPIEIAVEGFTSGGQLNISLVQNNNGILLTQGRTDTNPPVEVRTLGNGARFRWRDSLWEISEHGLYWVEARNRQFSNVQLFKKDVVQDEPSWLTMVRPFTPNEPKYQEAS